MEVNFKFTNRKGKRANLLPAESLVHFCSHTFHFVSSFHSTFDAHDPHLLHYDAMNELKRLPCLIVFLNNFVLGFYIAAVNYVWYKLMIRFYNVTL